MSSKQQDEPRTDRTSRYDPLLDKAATFYRKTLQREHEAFAYLKRLGLHDEDLLERFQIGYCNGSLLKILPDQEDVRSSLRKLGVLHAAKENEEEDQERLLDCITFPLHDRDGGTVGLCGQHMQQGRMVPAPRGPGIWNLPAAGMFPTVMLATTVLDGLSLHLAGYANAAALVSDIPGQDDVDVLEQSAVQQLHMVSHQPIPEKLLQVLASTTCYLRQLPEAPIKLLRHRGAEELASVLEASPRNEAVAPSMPGCMEILEGGFAVVLGPRRYEIRGLDKGRLKLRATVRVEHGGRLHIDTVDLYAARSRKALCRDLCSLFNEAHHVIEADINRLLLMSESHDPDRTNGLEVRSADPASLMSPKERKDAEALGKSPDLMQSILDDYAHCGLVGEEPNKLLSYLAAVSRKTQDPLSVLILSSSGAGKSALQEATLAFCPPEDVVKLTSLTGKALFYKGRRSLKHKILALEEQAGAERADYAIRNLISAGELIIETTIKDTGTGKLTTMENRVEGPTTVFITTTDPEVDPETRSRFFVTGVDESREQTRAILASQRKRHTLSGEANPSDRDALLLRHHNFQRLLKPLKVINPYAEELAYVDDRLQSRRDQPKFLNLIRAVAFLRQMSKKVKTSPAKDHALDYIEVDEEDLRIAYRLAVKVLGNTLEDLNQVSRDLLGLLDEMITQRIEAQEQETPPRKIDVQFTRREIREFTGWSHARIHRYLKQLVELEYVLQERGHDGIKYLYRLAYEDIQDLADHVLDSLLHLKEIMGGKEPTAKKRGSSTVSVVSPFFSVPDQG